MKHEVFYGERWAIQAQHQGQGQTCEAQAATNQLCSPDRWNSGQRGERRRSLSTSRALRQREQVGTGKPGSTAQEGGASGGAPPGKQAAEPTP